MTTEDEQLARRRTEAQAHVEVAKLRKLEAQRTLIVVQRELIEAQNALLNAPTHKVVDA